MGMPLIPTGREFAALMHAMTLDPLELVPSPPRTYPTNYFEGYPRCQCGYAPDRCKHLRCGHPVPTWSVLA